MTRIPRGRQVNLADLVRCCGRAQPSDLTPDATPCLSPLPTDPAARDWGMYRQAVRRWESVLVRPAPPATTPDDQGRSALNPEFVEWMMGLKPGYITDLDLSQRAQLHALGNGVVPQQAAYALTTLLRTAAEYAVAIG